MQTEISTRMYTRNEVVLLSLKIALVRVQRPFLKRRSLWLACFNFALLLWFPLFAYRVFAKLKLQITINLIKNEDIMLPVPFSSVWVCYSIFTKLTVSVFSEVHRNLRHFRASNWKYVQQHGWRTDVWRGNNSSNIKCSMLRSCIACRS
jgi:hypothetical protein